MSGTETAPAATRVLVADAESAVRMGLEERLRRHPELDVRVGTSLAAGEDEILAQARDVEVICVALGRVGRRVIETAGRLRLVVKTGIGTDNIDVAAAREHGVGVLRTAGVNVRGVAEYVIGAAIAHHRRFRELDAAVRDGRWDEVRRELAGRIPALSDTTLGIVGLGAIGRDLAELARAHRMDVVAFDPYLSEERAAAAGARLVDLEELLRVSDVVSVHAILTESTHHLIGEAELASMRPTALLVNGARGPIVDEAALARALQAGRIAGAVVDVFEREPLPPDSPLLTLENCVLSPHLAGCTAAGYAEIGALAEELVLRFVGGRRLPPECVVSEPRERPATAVR